MRQAYAWGPGTVRGCLSEGRDDGDGKIPEDLRSEASAAIAASDLSDRVDLVATTRRESELVGLQHRFERELIGVNEGAPITIDAVANVVTGKVDLFVPSSAERTAAQSEWVREAQDRFGTVIRIRKSPGKLELR
jgi:hypothetical protein